MEHFNLFVQLSAIFIISQRMIFQIFYDLPTVILLVIGLLIYALYGVSYSDFILNHIFFWRQYCTNYIISRNAIFKLRNNLYNYPAFPFYKVSFGCIDTLICTPQYVVIQIGYIDIVSLQIFEMKGS